MDPARATSGRHDLTAEERNAVWEHATRVAADAAAQIRDLAGTNPAAAADAAWATSDTLHVAAAVLGSRILRQAADAYDRAARAPYGRIPPPTPVGNQLRQAARLLSAFAYLTGDRSHGPDPAHHQAGRARRSRRRTPRIPAARRPGRRRTRAAERLYAATRPAPAPPPRPAPRASTAAQLAGLSFPHQPACRTTTRTRTARS